MTELAWVVGRGLQFPADCGMARICGPGMHAAEKPWQLVVNPVSVHACKAGPYSGHGPRPAQLHGRAAPPGWRKPARCCCAQFRRMCHSCWHQRTNAAQAEVHSIVGAHEQGGAAQKAQLDQLLRHLPERLRASGAFRMDVSHPLLHSLSRMPRETLGCRNNPEVPA